MNLPQRIVLATGVFAVAVMILFPPWLFVFDPPGDMFRKTTRAILASAKTEPEPSKRPEPQSQTTTKHSRTPRMGVKANGVCKLGRILENRAASNQSSCSDSAGFCDV